MILLVIMLIVFMFVLFSNSESKMLKELKIQYWSILDMLRQTGDPTWIPVLKPAIITGMHGKKDGVIGSNVNKGYEIYICLDGDDVNSATYVLIHELAHMSVPEYDHTNAFWNNFKKLKKLAIEHGLYTPEGSRTYCGETIRE